MAVLAASAAAHGQTYDVDIGLGIANTNPFDFSGSLLVNKNGSLSNVDVHDPFDNGAFTAALVTQLGGGKEAVTLYVYEGRYGPSSQEFALSFDVNAPLGGSTKTLSVSDVLFNIDSNFAYQCGQGRPGYPVTCTGSVTPAAARDALRARAYLALSRATATISGYVTIAVDIHIGRLVMPKSARIALILIAAITANATADEAKPQAVRTILERHDQAGVVGKEILIGTATLPAESVIGYHTHPGDEIGYVLKGTLVLKTRGQPDRILKAGESFFNPRGAVHSLAAAPGGDGGMEVSTWIVDKDKPLVNLVP